MGTPVTPFGGLTPITFGPAVSTADPVVNCKPQENEQLNRFPSRSVIPVFSKVALIFCVAGSNDLGTKFIVSPSALIEIAPGTSIPEPLMNACTTKVLLFTVVGSTGSFNWMLM